ncbi:MAG: NAD(P)-dependent oxidoreductase [Pseudomonadota bacterium]
MRIGFLGFGIMGLGMVRNLLNAGHSVQGWNRSHRDLPEEVANHEGLTLMASIADAVNDAEMVMICVTGPEAQDAIYGDLANALSENTLVVDLTTTDPDFTTLLAETITSAGGRYIDAPVFGSRNEAWNGELDIVIGGEADDVAEAMPLLDVLAKTTHIMGPTPAGAQMKLVGNLLVAAQMASLGEGLSLARKAGLPAEAVTNVLGVVDFSSLLIANISKASLANDYTPFFYLKHMLKDARLIGQFARSMEVPVPHSTGIAEAYQAAVNAGLGDLNASGLHKMQFEMAGLGEGPEDG